MGNGGPFPGGKAPLGRDADHSPPPPLNLVPRSRMSSSYISSPPKRLRGVWWDSFSIKVHHLKATSQCFLGRPVRLNNGWTWSPSWHNDTDILCSKVKINNTHSIIHLSKYKPFTSTRKSPVKLWKNLKQYLKNTLLLKSLTKQHIKAKIITHRWLIKEYNTIYLNEIMTSKMITNQATLAYYSLKTDQSLETETVTSYLIPN
jgi:hypothetical protein